VSPGDLRRSVSGRGGAPRLATDPICGMAVAAGQDTTSHLRRDGETWWFCSTDCRDEFAARNPSPARDTTEAVGS
jgi:YHS domain-containing protein